MELTAADSIMVAAWPECVGNCLDEETERQIDIVQSVIRSIREVRSQYNIAPSKKVACSASASDAMCGVCWSTQAC